jgi:S1-C subfamily serine protease
MTSYSASSSAVRVTGYSGYCLRRPNSAKKLGSGVIMTPDGYILTNNHVVDGATEVRVMLGDKREFKARVVGADPKTDVAVLRIDATNLPAITIADSTKVEVGDYAIAIGNPFGVGRTVTMGIVSATGRSHLGIEDYEDFIQTDAPINPGKFGRSAGERSGPIDRNQHCNHRPWLGGEPRRAT